MKVAIIEPNLIDYTGHYYSFVTELKRGFEELGDEVKVFLPKNSSSEIIGDKILPSKKKDQKNKFLRYFEFPFETLKYFLSLKKIQKTNDIFIFPSAENPAHLLGGASFLGKQIPLILYFHSPDHFLSPLRKSARLFFFLSNLFRRRVVCLTPVSWNINLLKKYRLNNIGFFDQAPYPLNFVRTHEMPKTGNYFFLSYLGDARKEKNFEKLVETIKYSENDLGFIVQCHPPAIGFYEPGIKEAIENLKTINKKRIRIYQTPLSRKEYCGLLSESSIIWCLYEEKSYRNRVSGILLEAWSFGKPVITTAGTWMGMQVEKYGGGVVLNDLEISEILQGIKKIKDNYEKFSSEAKLAGELLYEKNNGIALARFIKEILQNKTNF